jgi:CDP-diacylglycerol--glycerol-3-phosphate 3-phosphatidyltransferase
MEISRLDNVYVDELLSENGEQGINQPLGEQTDTTQPEHIDPRGATKTSNFNLPNCITIARIIIVIPFVLFVYWVKTNSWMDQSAPFLGLWSWSLVILFAGISATDAIDGRIARKRGLVTDLGKFLDPIADKILIIGLLLCVCFMDFTIYGDINMGLVFAYTVLIIIREVAVSALRYYLKKKKDVVVAANILGKFKTAFQCFYVGFLLSPLLDVYGVEYAFSDFPFYVIMFAIVLGGITVIITYISGFSYFKAAFISDTPVDIFSDINGLDDGISSSLSNADDRNSGLSPKWRV